MEFGLPRPNARSTQRRDVKHPVVAQANIAIIRRSSLQIAPEGIFFEVVVSGFATTGPGPGEVYDPRFHDLYYFWEFGDSYDFKAPKNLLDRYRNSSRAYGPMASHTYRKPGRYQVSVLVVEPGTGAQASASMNVTIGDPEPVFFGRNTIYVDASGNGAGAPSKALITTSLDAAISMVQGQERTPKRIMLRRGQTFTHSGSSMGHSVPWPSCHIVAAPGNKANPVVMSSGEFFWNDQTTKTNGTTKDWTFQNIDFFGLWDATTELGQPVSCITTHENSPNLLLIDGSLFDGFAGGFVAGAGRNILHRAAIINDTTITNWQGFGVIDGDNTAIALTGCSIRQHIHAQAGQTDLSGNTNGPFRNGAQAERTLVHSCEMYSRTGWSTIGETYQAYQPCIRFNTSGVEGVRANIQANTFEGGFWVIHFAPEAGQSSRAVNALFEKNYVLGCHQTGTLVKIQMGGTTIRNNILVQPDTKSLPTTGALYAFVELANPEGNTTNRITPISVYNNTYVNLTSARNFLYPEEPAQTLAGADHFTRVHVANNIEYQPNLTVPLTGDAPLQTGPALWSPHEIGYRSDVVPLQPLTATPANTMAIYAPLTGSDALGDAVSDPVAYDDFYGKPRPPHPSRGALERPKK